ncbi:MAG: MerR family transcriptional regulator [Myxococcota bacterium]
MSRSTDLPDKLFFRIGEAADIVGVEPHVLRYWEEQFDVLRPRKTRGSHRKYSRRDVEIAVLIRRLLHEEGFTIPGAKRRLRELGHKRSNPPEARERRDLLLRAELLSVREQLVELRRRLDREAEGPAEEPVQKVTVQEVVPSPVRPGRTKS